jgi:hypothetical protein
MCPQYKQRGSCRFGDECDFAHTQEQASSHAKTGHDVPGGTNTTNPGSHFSDADADDAVLATPPPPPRRPTQALYRACPPRPRGNEQPEAWAAYELRLQRTQPPPAGYIFVCNSGTQEECHDRMLLGSVPRDWPEVRLVGACTALFLLNVQTRRVHGVFWPDGPPAMDIEPEAWGGSKKGSRKKGSRKMGSRFPAQLRVVREAPDDPMRRSIRTGDLCGVDTSTGPTSGAAATQLLRAFGVAPRRKQPSDPTLMMRAMPPPRAVPPPSTLAQGWEGAAAAVPLPPAMTSAAASAAADWACAMCTVINPSAALACSCCDTRKAADAPPMMMAADAPAPATPDAPSSPSSGGALDRALCLQDELGAQKAALLARKRAALRLSDYTTAKQCNDELRHIETQLLSAEQAVDDLMSSKRRRSPKASSPSPMELSIELSSRRSPTASPSLVRPTLVPPPAELTAAALWSECEAAAKWAAAELTAEQRNAIGKRLYPLVQQTVAPDKASKVTGMLLELSQGELLRLLGDHAAMQAKLVEATNALAQMAPPQALAQETLPLTPQTMPLSPVAEQTALLTPPASPTEPPSNRTPPAMAATAQTFVPQQLQHTLPAMAATAQTFVPQQLQHTPPDMAATAQTFVPQQLQHTPPAMAATAQTFVPATAQKPSSPRRGQPPMSAKTPTAAQPLLTAPAYSKTPTAAQPATPTRATPSSPHSPAKQAPGQSDEAFATHLTQQLAALRAATADLRRANEEDWDERTAALLNDKTAEAGRVASELDVFVKRQARKGQSARRATKIAVLKAEHAAQMTCKTTAMKSMDFVNAKHAKDQLEKIEAALSELDASS